MSSIAWVNAWAKAITKNPISRLAVVSRLSALLAGETVNGIAGKPASENPKDMLSTLIVFANWESSPGAFDILWGAIFDIANSRGWTEEIRDQTYLWTEQCLLGPAWDTEPADDDEKSDGEEFDNSWIACSLGSARLFSLGYGYSAFAWNALLDGLGLGGEAKSDSMRIGACAQLLAGGKRIKLHILGGGNEHPTPGLAGKYLDAQPENKRPEWEKNGAEMWKTFLDVLVKEQAEAGPKAAALLQITRKHLLSKEEDLTSEQVAGIIWPNVDTA